MSYTGAREGSARQLVGHEGVEGVGQRIDPGETFVDLLVLKSHAWALPMKASLT
jgi:hypothetical protein